MHSLLSSNLVSKNIKTEIFRTIISPVVYGCESWSLTLREEHRLRVLIIFGTKRDEVTGEWRRLCNEELNELYPLPNIIQVIKLRRMRWVGHVAHMGERRGACRDLVENPEEK